MDWQRKLVYVFVPNGRINSFFLPPFVVLGLCSGELCDAAVTKSADSASWI